MPTPVRFFDARAGPDPFVAERGLPAVYRVVGFSNSWTSTSNASAIFVIHARLGLAVPARTACIIAGLTSASSANARTFCFRRLRRALTFLAKTSCTPAKLSGGVRFRPATPRKLGVSRPLGLQYNRQL